MQLPKSALLLIVMMINSLVLEKVEAQATIIQQGRDEFIIELQKNPDSSITLLQLTDLHLGGSKEGAWEKDLITFQRIEEMVDLYDPDVILITGDLLTGEKPFGSMLCIATMNFFDKLERPWLYVFGNHDPEGGFGRESIAKVFSKSKWGVLGKHINTDIYEFKYDYLVNIKFQNSVRPAWQIYGFDSGSRPGSKSIKEDQLKWYGQKSKETEVRYNGQIPAIAMFHIPLIQFEYLRTDNSIVKYGRGLEKATYEEDDGSVYDYFLKTGNIKAVLVGHDHYNNYWGRYDGGIILSFGFISGASTKHAWPVGGKLIKLSPEDDGVQLENVSPGFDAYNDIMID